MRAMRMWLLLAAALTIVATLYHSVLGHGFVWDDFIRFVHNPSLRVGDISPGKLLVPLFADTSYLRPVVLLSFALEFHLLGVDSGISHAINLISHLLSTTLVFAIALRLFRSNSLGNPDWRAAIAALIYGAHPALVEATAWMSGRYDLLVTLFVLCGLAADAYIRPRALRVLALATSFALALGSKEMAVTMPVALLLQRLAVDRPPNESLLRGGTRVLRQEWLAVAALGLVFAVYVALRVRLFGGFMEEHRGLATAVSGLPEHLWLILNALGVYVLAILSPFSILAPLDPFGLAQLYNHDSVVRGVLAVLTLTMITRFAFRRAPTALLLLSALISLVPVLHLVPMTIGGNLANDRFLTLPLTFCAIAATSIRFDVLRSIQPKMQALLVGGIAMIWMPMAINSVYLTVPLWRSDLVLWSWMYSVKPDVTAVQALYLGAALREKRYDLMKPVLERLVAKGPLEVDIQMTYAAYLYETGQTDEAELYVLGGLAAYPLLHQMTPAEQSKVPNSASARFKLAAAYSTLVRVSRKKGDLNKALEYVDIALFYKTELPALLVMKSEILLELDRVAEAETAYRRALELLVPAAVPHIVSDHNRLIQRLCASPATPPRRACTAASAGVGSG